MRSYVNSTWEMRRPASENSVYVIAEIGVNHNGDLRLARQLIDAATTAGADCVKFQTFKAEEIVAARAPKAAYQLAVTDGNESQFEMLKALELDDSAFEALVSHCRKRGVDFLSTPYSLNDIALLQKLGVDAFKVASGQIVEPPFLRHVAQTGKPIYLSTGMATLPEVVEAVHTIRGEGNQQITLLQCTTNYPSRIEDANLLAIRTMAMALETPMGYSDHTSSDIACLVAIGLGARVVEKHLTMDRSLPGPDHRASATPETFRRLCNAIREAEAVLGTGCKEPCETELANAQVMRRSLVASRSIAPGEILHESMFTFKRPGTGISPALLSEVSGRRALAQIDRNEFLTWTKCGSR